MSFKITSKVKGWKAIIAVLATLSNEDSVFQLRQDGIFFKAYSNGKYMIAFFLWQKENHTTYEISEEKEIGFKLVDFEKILNRFDKDNEVTVTQENEDPSILKIQSGQKEFQMRLLNPQALNFPDRLSGLDYTHLFDVPVQDFKAAIEDVAVFAEFLQMKVEDGNLTVRSYRDQFGKYKGILKSGLEGNIESYYSVEFVINIIKAVEKFTETVSCEFGNYPKPFYMKITIPDVGIIDYYIAAIMKGEGE